MVILQIGDVTRRGERGSQQSPSTLFKEEVLLSPQVINDDQLQLSAVVGLVEPTEVQLKREINVGSMRKRSTLDAGLYSITAEFGGDGGLQVNHYIRLFEKPKNPGQRPSGISIELTQLEEYIGYGIWVSSPRRVVRSVGIDALFPDSAGEIKTRVPAMLARARDSYGVEPESAWTDRAGINEWLAEHDTDMAKFLDAVRTKLKELPMPDVKPPPGGKA